MARRSSLFLKIFIVAVIVVALAAVTHNWWLAAMGRFLVHDDGPSHADIAVVLAGDYFGNRIMRAGELVKQGYVPNVMVSGPNIIYGFDECDLEIPFAMKNGYPQSWFIHAPNQTRSTRDEAGAIVPELRRRGVHKFLLVTSDFHSARARRIFQAAAPDMEVRMVAARDEYFTPDGWWHNREGRKTFVFEWLKTVGNALRM